MFGNDPPTQGEVAMLSKCANPECSATFRYLHDGKLFRFEVEVPSSGEPAGMVLPEMKKRATRLEFFWLCEKCAGRMTVIFKVGEGGSVRAILRAKGAAS
jgi:hypothetical protein